MSKPSQPVVLEHRAVSQHRGGTITQGQLENRGHIAVQERFAAREVVFLDAQRHGLIEGPANRLQIEKTELMIVRTATDEAVRAGEVANGARTLKGKVVKECKFDEVRLRSK